ncbi:MAG: pantetheine-phosphate adenylyltransferase [Clostridiales bacterium]|nr:pantetheine-phosphate adenylyltransferase [Clostridiales bacterium]
MRVGIYPGSFDPVTLGHIDMIKRACAMFDKVIVAVLINADKQACFSISERMRFLESALKEANITNVEIDSFNGLLADYAKRKNACAVVRGLRAVSDFDYEFQMALTNKRLNPDMETVFFTAQSEYMYLSSGTVKQVAALGGDITGFVPEIIKQDIINKSVNKN